MSPNKKPQTEEKETDSEECSKSEKVDKDTNGLVIEAKYIPEEMLTEIFKFIDNKTLLFCHLVCKQWEKLLKSYAWRRKAQYVTGRKLPADDKVPWTSYYYLCEDLPFGKNLIYDKVAPYQNDKTIKVIEFGRGEDIPVNIYPFPDDDTFQGKCIITGNNRHHNRYIIDLLEEGFTTHVLDKVQPIVKVCEWYAVDKDAKDGNYSCTYKLENEESIMRTFNYDKGVHKKGEWIKFTHSFKNYGEGLRKIKFYHSASRGVVMVGASVTLEVNIYHDIKRRKLSPFREHED